MREGLFIRKNKNRWERLEHPIPLSADEMASEFTKLVDDLAYSKTFYPASRVTQYINSLAAKIYLGIYRNRKEESNRLVKFWKYDVPIAVGKHHLIILFALIIFFVFFSAGFFSSVKEPGFVRQVLGDSYVDMTEKNIREGNPFNVYANENSFVMWMWIMANNLLVSFRYFFRGLALGIPCLTDLSKEAIRLGTFEHMFYAKGLGAQAIVTVLIHGMLELTAIIITSAAGIVMGTGYLFPQTGSRFDGFRNGAKDGVKMVLGLIPIFMIAAFFEGYVTRFYKMPSPLSLFILMITGSFVVWYFIIFPVRLKNKLNKAGEMKENE